MQVLALRQAVRVLHDPDEFVMVTECFEAYFQMLMDQEYDFITEDSIEE